MTSEVAAGQPITNEDGTSAGSLLTRSSRLSRATGSDPTSGAPASWCSTRPSRRPTAASGESPGAKYWPARRHSIPPAAGCPTKHSTRFASCWSASRATDDTGRRRDPIAECRVAADSGSLRLFAPVQYFQGVPSPVKQPELTDMVIFPREL